MSIDYYDMKQFSEPQLDKVLISKLSDANPNNKLDEFITLSDALSDALRSDENQNKLDKIISVENRKVLKDEEKKDQAYKLIENREYQKLEKAQEKLQIALENISYTNDVKMYVQFQNIVVLKNKVTEKNKSIKNLEKPTLKDAKEIIGRYKPLKNNKKKAKEKKKKAEGETKYQIKLRF